MKAIQIKLLSATDKLKAWTEAGSIVEERTYQSDIEIQAGRLAIRYWKEKGWNNNTKISGFGTLPNGDWVATLESK